MTDNPNDGDEGDRRDGIMSILRDNNYRVQTDIKCCLTCKHRDVYYCLLVHYETVDTAITDELGICDKYEARD